MRWGLEGVKHSTWHARSQGLCGDSGLCPPGVRKEPWLKSSELQQEEGRC